MYNIGKAALKPIKTVFGSFSGGRSRLGWIHLVPGVRAVHARCCEHPRRIGAVGEYQGEAEVEAE